MRARTNLLITIIVLGIGIFIASRILFPIENTVNLGLDLQGGSHVVLEAQDTDEIIVDRDVVNRILEIVRRRVDGLGVSEPIIQIEGERRIIVQLPGIDDPMQAVEAIGRTAMLQFINRHGQVVLTGAALRTANAWLHHSDNEPIIDFSLTEEGTKEFARITEEHVGRRLSIMLDGETLANPLIEEVIDDGRGHIRGFHSIEEAQRIALLLRAGALPVPVEIIENRSIGPSLGQDLIDRSVRAAIIGLILVGLYMLIFYRLAGFVADQALIIYGLIVIGIMSILGATLTLPGVAGLILSIGMAVDANVIIFERVKEELAVGMTPYSATRTGFSRAFRTILDANVTTLAIAAVLAYYGTGMIRGFAIVLSIGILTSMFTALTVTRKLLEKVLALRKVKNGNVLIGMIKQAFNFDIIGRRKLWYLISGTLLAFGFLMLLINGLNFGIDFTGGTILEMQFSEDITVADTRNILAEFNLDDSVIQQSGTNTMFIRTEPLGTGTITAIQERFGEDYAGMDILRTEEVGPTIGDELKANALYALFFASILIIIYISIRFEFKFAMAAIIALLHDVFIVIGLFSLLQWQINSPFIAGILLIIGYSINDTIVIFDKIRENMKRSQGKESFSQLANRSLNETLVRSINTSCTTMLVILSLLIFGGGSLQSFIFALLLGALTGTYSSIFIASPILVSWHKLEEAKAIKTAEGLN